MPSEVLLLKWGDVDWENARFTVTSPKTEHHDGKGTRCVPIFPELLPYLQEAFDQAEPGSVYCITRYRDPATNLRTQLQRIIRRASLNAWPKLWQNLRATRETEFADEFPSHVVCAWIGNSEPVAIKHYLQVTDEHFMRAVQSPEAVQNPVQQTAATDGKVLHPETANRPGDVKNNDLQRDATPCDAEDSNRWAIQDSNQ